ncbi:MAG: long-chain-fatty-acid--CoA ligase [Novosphingobium sp.]|jgi:acyl-CoA synthetase (AMP-forming)/AMP-acid ligase II|uniref:long-chain-fatty-acid--CoA ligase n=1 Tax=Novosphingobium sp. TaxID=1874826 RepID=UPI0039188590
MGPETFDALLRHWAALRPDRRALDGPDGAYGYAQLLEATDRLLAGMQALGLGMGDRVAWLGKNSALYFMLLYAAGRAGIVMVPIGWRLADVELQWIAGNAQVKAVFLGDGFTRSRALFADLATKPRCIDADEARGWLAQANKPKIAPSQSDDAVLQLYTSGTTGHPKGAVLSNKNLFQLRNHPDAAQSAYFDIRQDEEILIAMPCAHIGGTGLGTMALGAGVGAVILSEFEPGAVFEAIENKGITRLFAVPAALQMLVNDPRSANADFSRLRHILYGAAPIPLELLRQCLATFGSGFMQAYGMTETTGTVVSLPPEDHDPSGTPRMRSAGKALPGVQLRIVDARGKDLPSGAIGEVVIRSSNTMLGYWQLPETTAEAVSSEGWIRTGDAGFLDDEGYLFIQDRVKDMIISGGENVYPAEVESAIYGHPAVADAAVIGVPDDKWGEAVKACVVPKAGISVDEASIINYARERIAAFKCPKSVDFVAEMPRNASGKILRRKLREPYWADRDRQVN